MQRRGGSRLVTWWYGLSSWCSRRRAAASRSRAERRRRRAALRRPGLAPVVPSAVPGRPRPTTSSSWCSRTRTSIKSCSGQAPYLDQLASSGVNFGNAYAEAHPSQPNYLALFSGSTQGVTDDSCLRPARRAEPGDALLAAGRSFVGYSEGLPVPGSRAAGAVASCRSTRRGRLSRTSRPAPTNPGGAWPDRYEQLPTVAVVIPDLCDDMHDCDVATGDRWLRDHLSDYLGVGAYAQQPADRHVRRIDSPRTPPIGSSPSSMVRAFAPARGDSALSITTRCCARSRTCTRFRPSAGRRTRLGSSTSGGRSAQALPGRRLGLAGAAVGAGIGWIARGPERQQHRERGG